MRGLVTVIGGSGFIGSQIVRALAKGGWRIRVAVRRPWQAYRARLLGDVGQIEIVQANVRAPETVERALEGAESAVYAVGAPFQSGRQTFESLRTTGPKAAAEMARALGVGRFVLVSGIGATDNSPSQAARATAAGERAVRDAVPDAVILRPSVVFGPDDAFFNKLGALATMSPVMPVFHPATRMQPVFVADVARAVAAAVADPAAAGETYELGGPAVYTLRELTQLVLAQIGRPRLLLPVPAPLAGLMGAAGDLTAFLRGPVPMLPEPPITTDQLALMSVDNVVSADRPGLAALGVEATALEAIIPTYLYRFRKGGQYAELTPPEPLRA